MHTITTRPPSPEEERLIARRAKPDVAAWGCLIILTGVVPAIFLGKQGAFVGRGLSADAATYGQWIGWAIAAALCVSLLVNHLPDERRTRKRAARDQQERIVQVIHVVEPRVIQIGPVDRVEPILAFDIGDNRILFLQGQWLFDSRTYGTDGPNGDLVGDYLDEYINALPPPHSFPSTEFTISRFPHSGEVLGIRVGGQYVAPQADVDALKPEYRFGDSEIFEGSLEEMARVLASEHWHRARQPTS